MTLHDVTMTKTDSTGTGSRPQIRCPGAPLTLAPQQTATCTATYRITQADVDQTRFSDTARATGRAPDGRTVHAAASRRAGATAPRAHPSQTASPARAAVGEMVRYTFAITNVGNNTLHNITVIEQKFTGSGHWSAVRCPACRSHGDLHRQLHGDRRRRRGRDDRQHRRRPRPHLARAGLHRPFAGHRAGAQPTS